MKKIVSRVSLRTALYIIIGSFVFLSFINFVQFPTSADMAKLDSLINAPVDLEAKVLQEINSHWYSNLTGYLPKFVFFDYISQKDNVVISAIYILTFVSFLTQVVLLSLSNYYRELSDFFSEKTLDSIFLYASEWAINAPPVLGVVGTIFSFGIVVSNISDMSSLSTVFKENFANAALTTIIGGSVYVMNLFLNIFIAKNLSK